MKKIAFLSFLTAFSGIAFTVQADEPIGPIPVTPDTMESSGAGTVKKVDGDYVLSFTSTTNTYTFTIPKDVSFIRYLVVAGGGAGGGWGGGGGGAGGMLENDAYSVEVGDVLTINVGKGGARQTGSGAGNDGEDSSITKETAVSGTTEIARAYGGGGGGSTPSKTSPDPAKAGGSGGGANGRCPSLTTGLTICAGGASLGSGQGNAGGGVADVNKAVCACGGGGAGKAADTCASTASGTSGGAGRVSNITGDDVTYAGGGAGASYYRYSRVSGGTGGGGSGGDYDKNTSNEYKSGDDGIDGLGGGGGGSVKADGAIHSGKGGDGIVIIRYTSSATAKATVHFSHESNTATWVATAYSGEVVEGAEVDDGATITVVATPKDGYEYLSVPEGWAKNADGTITAGFVATAPECPIQIPAAAAIDYVQVQFTSNGSAFYEATNVDGEAIGERVRAGTEVFVKIRAGVGFVYNETPTGWTLDAEGDAYTKAFTAVSGSTLAIQIPNAEEIGGTSTIDEQDGYMLAANDVFIVVFTNVTHQHTFILPDGVQSIRYLVVGGGGAGGGRRGGGGGAGGMLTDDEFKVVGRTLKINVGQGGEGVKSGTGTSGGNSKLENGIASIVAFGGGGGAHGFSYPAGEGGSGGGGGGTTGDQSTPLPGAPAKDPLQGNAGGTSSAYRSAAGGGGAGEAGNPSDTNTNAGGAGGAGRMCDITGEDLPYAAGGGGASRNSSSSGGVGGSGIGGAGGKNAVGLRAGLPGVDGTGSGGGGAAGDTDDYSGKGGDGVVIISYLAGGKQQLRFEENPLGTITASPAADGGVYEKNAEVTLTAVPKKEYLLSEWTINGEKAGNENPLVITMDSDKVVGASYTLNPDYYGVKRAETEDRPARVLIIGNSFSSWLGKDEEPGLGPIVRKLGRKVDVTALYYGACSLEQHWTNRDKVFYDLIRSSFDSEENPFAPSYNSEHELTLTQVLEMYDWDVITIQQASAQSYKAGSYEPYLGNLLGYIREKAPFAEVKFHETWSYSRYDPNNCFGDVAKRDEMYDGILNAVNEKVVPYGLDIIPTGYAVQLWRYRNNIYLRNTDITSDGDHHHFKENGEYLGAYAFCKRIFGEVPDEAKATVGGNDILSCVIDAANATDLSYYGQGTINFSWEVTFKDNSGTFADDTQSITNRACATVPDWTRDGFVLTGWLDESETVYTSEAVGSRPVVDDITYTAKWTPTFGKMTVMLNTTVSEATGFAPALGEYTYNEGVRVSFTAPTTSFLFNGGLSRGSVIGYRIDTKDEGGEWVLGEVQSGNSAEYTQGDDFTVERRFVWLLGNPEHQLVITQPAHGSITGTEGWYSEGTAVTIAAVATKPYEFLYWTGDAAGIESPLTITMNGPKTVSANISRAPLVRPENGYTIESIPNEMVVVFTNVNQQIDFKVPNGVSSIRYLVVAGGGSGGGYGGGGGGAGGMLEEPAYAVSAGDILTINVGKGGARQTGSGAGNNGNDSSIANGTTEVALAYGGGGGGSTPTKESPDPAKAGGSGGGANGRTSSSAISVCNGGATRGDNQGNVGGGEEASSVNLVASGGGGAGGSGGTSTGYSVRAGGGGAGRVSNITGSDVTYAGGGGGAGYYYGGGFGGSGIGGDGGDYNSGFTDEQKSGKDGKDGFGGGGGGCYKAGGDVHSGKGGDGVVIIRFAKPKGVVILFLM